MYAEKSVDLAAGCDRFLRSFSLDNDKGEHHIYVRKDLNRISPKPPPLFGISNLPVLENRALKNDCTPCSATQRS